MQKTAVQPRQSVAMMQSRRRENIAGYLFMAPSLLFFLGFVVFPMVMCLVYSFTDYTMTSFSFSGFANYQRMFQDAIFGKALWNTIILVLISVPVTCFFSLWAASIISKLHDRTTSFFRCVFYLPVVTGSVAVTVISRNMNWLGDASTALGCIITILLTTSVGQPIVLYVSALNNVDQSLVEAASVDGATNLQTFWRIKWPQIMPTTLYILVITTINSFQCFALIQLLTSGGPNHATETIMYYIYYNAFKLQSYGYGSAMGIILALIIAAFSALQFKVAQTDNG